MIPTNAELEHLRASHRQVVRAALDGHKARVLELVESYEYAIGETQLGWLCKLVAPHTAATRDLTAAYAAVARSLIS